MQTRNQGFSDNLVVKCVFGHRTTNIFNLYCWAKALDAEMIIVANDNSPQNNHPAPIRPRVNDNHLLQAVA